MTYFITATYEDGRIERLTLEGQRDALMDRMYDSGARGVCVMAQGEME